MTTGADRVAAKVAAMFPPDLADRVADLLGAYEPRGETGADRVRMAVLKLCAADATRIPELLDLATIDARDVIGEAEYPRQMRHPPGMATPEMILADRADYEAWLEES